ncbi:MAG: bifunctional lysylphosphatidylglycerol flippase/synthetase MprF [Sedimentisphaerales bacterium]|jgi:phosphatidylglycerol lysyltransferase
MRKFLRKITPWISVILFGIAAVIIHHKLRQYHYHDIVAELVKIPAHHILPAIALTFLDYFILTGYDTLALFYIGHRLPYRRIAVASFVGYVFSHNATILGGSAARYRIYSGLGLSAGQVARLILFCSITFWLGFLALGGFTFVLHPQAIEHGTHLPFKTTWPIGVIFLILLITYLIVTMVRKKTVTIRGWELAIPSSGLSLCQITLASIDWAVAGSVLYVLMTNIIDMNYPEFLEIFLLAQITGLISSVPGGLGVFEGMMLLLLSETAPASALIGTLLVYRVIYYLLPLGLASIILGAEEVASRRETLKRLGETIGKWAAMLIPQVFAVGSMAAGTILLVSGALPPENSRMEIIRDILPLSAVEISHFLGSIVGAGLIILARGLQRRLDAAYHLTIILFAAGIVFSLVKGFDYEEAIILAVMLAALIPCRGRFYRKASLLRDRFSLPWAVLVVVVAASSIWLGFFTYRHLGQADQLWWKFAFDANAPRFLRASTGVVVVILLFGIARLLVPAKPVFLPPPDTEIKIVENIVRNSPRTYAWLALLGDKRFLLDDNKDAFLMFSVHGRSWVSMGDPVGPEDDARELSWEFRELCDEYDAWPVFYQVDTEHLDIYLDLGLTFIKFGEEGRVELPNFSLEGHVRRDLRHAYNKMARHGLTFSVIGPAQVEAVLVDMKRVSDAWLESKNTREKKFSLGSFEPEYLRKMPAALITQQNKIVAFANIWQGANKEELSVDLMRYMPDSPEGIMDYMFTELLLWGKSEGYKWFNFGMAPLSGLEDRQLAPLWSQAGAFLFRHGEHFYNFQGLHEYKDKFSPVWQPKYIACPRGLMLPRILTNVAALVSGGIKGVVTK